MSDPSEIRSRLGYRRWACRLCPITFYSMRDAELHFHPEFSRHPGKEMSLMKTIDLDMEMKVEEEMKRWR